MKKSILGLAFLSIATFVVSCSNNDDNNDTPSSTFVLVQDDLKGSINDGEVVLEANKTYMLTGALTVKNGAKLTIEAGAEIIATENDGEIRYIAVAQGAQIFVNGTASNPVVMTSEIESPAAWGGLVICGKAPINKGETASAEVSGLTYGGTNATDNSGSIKYLRIEYSGYAYNSEKEFNALSFFGVGSGTTVEYVQSYNGSDDAFEWFGGTVNVKYLVSINDDQNMVGDDIFDWTEGWTGNAEYLYGKRTNDGARGIEADNNSNNNLATPISFPHISNITLISTGATTGDGDDALKLRVGTKGIFDNLVLVNWTTGFNVEHDATIGYVGTDLMATNVQFINVATKSKGKDSNGNTVDVSGVYSEVASATGAGNGESQPTWAQGWTVGF